jgi:hypothetical protein
MGHRVSNIRHCLHEKRGNFVTNQSERNAQRGLFISIQQWPDRSTHHFPYHAHHYHHLHYLIPSVIDHILRDLVLGCLIWRLLHCGDIVGVL